MAKCRSCEGPIVWATMASGKQNPIDEQPSPKGNLVLINGKATFATEEDRRLLRPLHTSHFATCSDAASFRRKGP